MSKKSGCLIIVMAVTIFLAYIALRQGYNTIYNDDWSDLYTNQKALVVGIVKDSSYIRTTGTGSWYYSFEPVVKYTFNKRVVYDTLISYRSVEKPDFSIGDSLAIEFRKDDGNISNSETTDRTGTGIINILQGIFFLVIAYFAYRYLKKDQKKNMRIL